MGDEGLELDTATSDSDNKLRQSQNPDRPQSSPITPDVWAALPDSVREAIAGLIRPTGV